MPERALNLANIVACVAAAAGNTVAGGAASLTAAALSGTSLWDSLNHEEKTLAQELANAFERHLAQASLSSDQCKIAAQIFERVQPDLADLARGDMDADKIADAMNARVKDVSRDPAHKTARVLYTYTNALREILPPLLVPRDKMEAMQQEALQRLTRLEGLLGTSGQFARLRDEGITEKAIIRLAQRIARDTEDLGQAWIELQNAMDIAVRVQREGRIPSNHGDFVDEVLRRVADLTAQGDYAGARDALTQAMADEDAAHRARKSRLLDSAAEVAMLQGDAETAANHLIARADLDAGGRAGFKALRALRKSYHETGRDKGTALDLEIAIALARVSHDHASTKDERGAALNDLAISLSILGARESGPARLEEAVAAYRTALLEWTRDHRPLHWAMTQMNLGRALWSLGERESGTERLEEAVAAYRAALEETRRDRVPQQWAETQQSLGNALRTLGERERGTAKLEEAVAAFRAVLEERPRARAPLDWATTQQNLGNALLRHGARESGTARLEEAVVAYRAALEELTRDRVPLVWAGTQQNLGLALLTLGGRESGTARLEEAIAAYRAALEETTRHRVPLQWAGTQKNLGTALRALGDRESGTAWLEDAVAAYRVALEELTRDHAPLVWAETQSDLGNALQNLGERESGTARLEEAVVAYRAALEERTRDRKPLGWAMTQQNLGSALTRLGDRESGTARLEEAVVAFRAALEEQTRDCEPLGWAMIQANLGNVERAFFDKTGDAAHLDRAKAYAEAAREVFAEAGASHYVEKTDVILAAIAARRGG